METVRVPDPAPTAEQGYADMVACYGEPVRAYVARLTGNRSIADDVYQETLLRAWRHRRALFGREGSVRSWLYTVAHNAAVDVLRGRRAYPVADETWAVLQRPVQDHADAVVATAYLMPALRRLTAEHRDVIFELYFRRSTVTEAAKSIGIPPGTVKSRAHYAIRALRAELVPLMPEFGSAPSTRSEDLP
ncbi:sigma-70 family RNA polymerase sigma factor [Micromonospora halophytica]|uniref:RNA polymerase sigma-70 factor, ECF subfamily n=1 Tax=Micromonospora halophytica TaxID=47864 RepID=A0A1C5JKD0_9ACTN|nr:sigma-70 family RNA polymerase sigma factor [Micromonospora halophytica]SCG71022.1 RNA polymerase sigma-70 factor, ECF subfamily [Micromonospora halophytica]